MLPLDPIVSKRQRLSKQRADEISNVSMEIWVSSASTIPDK